ncbi:MAG: YkgJ family cysteine cluster protein, partial [Clostridia bacterium]|nr:YkgJ family cysteine cluster protein [Clostridia bacterium]
MGKLMDALAAPRAVSLLKTAWEMLDSLTPLRTDCGRLCGGACCQTDETGENGMLLLPFEDRFYRKPIEGFRFALRDDDSLFKGGRRLVCEGVCPREHRPIACRIFPLRMSVLFSEQDASPQVTAELDPRAWAVCPLLEQGGLRAMRGEFAAAV